MELHCFGTQYGMSASSLHAKNCELTAYVCGMVGGRMVADLLVGLMQRTVHQLLVQPYGDDDEAQVWADLPPPMIEVC